MDGPTWWNNRFWRPATAFNGDTRFVRQPQNSSSYTPLSPWHSFSRLNGRRVIRPTLRPDQFRRENSRPLGSLRVTHGRKGTMDYYGSLRQNGHAVTSLSVDGGLPGSSTPMTFFSFTSRPPTPMKRSKDESHEDTPLPKGDSTPSTRIPQTQPPEQVQSETINRNIASHFGRRIVRPQTSGGVITRVGDLKVVDLEESLNIQTYSKYNGTSATSTDNSQPKEETEPPRSQSVNPNLYRTQMNGEISIEETSPLKVPLKSILKKNDSPVQNGHTTNNRTPSSQETEEVEEKHNEEEHEVVEEEPAQVEEKPPRFAIPGASGRPIPSATSRMQFPNDQQQQRILLRRGLRSAPALKREVRFNMRNNAVIEYFPSEAIREFRQMYI